MAEGRRCSFPSPRPLDSEVWANPLTQHKANVTSGLPQLYLPRVFPGTYISSVSKGGWAVGWAVRRLPRLNTGPKIRSKGHISAYRTHMTKGFRGGCKRFRWQFYVPGGSWTMLGAMNLKKKIRKTRANSVWDYEISWCEWQKRLRISTLVFFLFRKESISFVKWLLRKYNNHSRLLYHKLDVENKDKFIFLHLISKNIKTRIY